MDIIQLIITAAGFIGLLVYQHYKIKTLKDQTTIQTELFQNFKIYFDIVNPEILKYRMEQYEKIVEKQKSIEFAQFEQKLSKDMETKLNKSHDSLIKVLEIFKDVSLAFLETMRYIPHNKRKMIINKIQDDDLKKAYQKSLPMYEELDRIRQQTLLQVLNDTEQNK